MSDDRNELIRIANLLTLKKHDFSIPSLDEHSETFILDINSKIKNAFDSRALALPDFKLAGSILVFSDYGGEDKSSDFYTYTHFMTSFDFGRAAIQEIRKIKDKYKFETEIAYKNLASGRLARAVPDIMQVMNNCHGFIFTHIVDKRIYTLGSDNTEKSLLELHRICSAHGFDSWKPTVFEKVWRITNQVGYLMAVLGKDVHKVFWMTDQDSICSNPRQLDQLGTLYARYLHHYSKGKKFENIGFAKSFDRKIGAEDMNDLVSIADLYAGCLASMTTQHYRGEFLNISKNKTASVDIIKTLSFNGLGLSKFNVIHKKKGNLLECASVGFTPAEDFNMNLETIPIFYPQE